MSQLTSWGWAPLMAERLAHAQFVACALIFQNQPEHVTGVKLQRCIGNVRMFDDLNPFVPLWYIVTRVFVFSVRTCVNSCVVYMTDVAWLLTDHRVRPASCLPGWALYVQKVSRRPMFQLVVDCTVSQSEIRKTSRLTSMFIALRIPGICYHTRDDTPTEVINSKNASTSLVQIVYLFYHFWWKYVINEEVYRNQTQKCGFI